jgi:hypothetical protein
MMGFIWVVELKVIVVNAPVVISLVYFCSHLGRHQSLLIWFMVVIY